MSWLKTTVSVLFLTVLYDGWAIPLCFHLVLCQCLYWTGREEEEVQHGFIHGSALQMVLAVSWGTLISSISLSFELARLGSLYDIFREVFQEGGSCQSSRGLGSGVPTGALLPHSIGEKNNGASLDSRQRNRHQPLIYYTVQPLWCLILF